MPDFADGKETKMTRFHYVGNVNTAEGAIHVVLYSHVITGMPCPRGYGAIIFFDKQHNYLGEINPFLMGGNVGPLWCDDGKLYLFGRTKFMHIQSAGTRNNGNALDLSKGWKNRKLLDIYEYGSSGGINDKVPTKEERRNELKTWDDK